MVLWMIPNRRPFHWMRCQCLKMHWQCFEMILKWICNAFPFRWKTLPTFQNAMKMFFNALSTRWNALQWKNATMLFSLSLLFPKRVTYDAGSENRTRATLVGGECSHHCTNPVLLFCYLVWFRTRRVASSSCHATRSQTVFCKRIGDCQDC